MVVVWFDALTPKQAKIGAYLYWELAGRGIGLLLTTRKYRYVEETLRAYSVPYVVVGKYGESLRDKLKSYASRTLRLLEILPDFDLALGFPSPEMHRIAFGLGKPIITLSDTAHAYHVNKLCLPLSSRVIVPEAIPESELLKFIPSSELSKVRKFSGVFELMWVKRVRVDASIPRRLGLRIGDYVLFRPEEEKASYYRYGTSPELHRRLIRIVLEHGLQLVYVPRYKHQEKLVTEHFSREIELGLVVIPRGMPIDLVHLEAFSRLVVTGGSTMAIESSLLGVPSLCYFPESFYIDDYLMRLGFPLIRAGSLEEAVNMLPSLLSSAEHVNVQDLVQSLEDPVKVILEDVLRIA